MAYLEEFDRIGDVVPVFDPLVRIAEEPPSMKSLVLSPTNGWITARTGCFALPRPVPDEQCAVRFDYRLLDKTNQRFRLQLVFGDATCDFMVDGAAKGGGLLSGNAWNHGVVTVDRGRAQLWLYRNGVRTLEQEAKVPVAPLTGWNVAAASGMSLDFVRVDAGTACPYGRGDLEECLRELADEAANEKPAEDAFAPIVLQFEGPAPQEQVAKKGKKGKKSPVSSVVFKPANSRKQIPTKRGEKRRYLELADGAVTVTIPGLSPVTVYSRPDLNKRYQPAEEEQIVAAWTNLPNIAAHRPKVEFAACEGETNGYGAWIDDNFVGVMKLSAPLKAGTYPVRAAGPADRVPLVYRKPFPLSRVRMNKGTYAYECNGFLQREVWSAMPSSALRSVPVAQYDRIEAICSIDRTAPVDFEPVIIARISSHLGVSGRSAAICESKVTLDETMRCGVAADGTPLYKAVFTFNPGEILDLTDKLGLPRLDVDFTGPLYDKDNYYISHARMPDKHRRSSVVLHRADVFRAPVSFNYTANRWNSVYYPDEAAGATVAFIAEKGVKARFTFRAVNAETGEEAVAFDFPVEGAFERKLDFPRTQTGLYDFVARVTAEDGHVINEHRGTYSLLPPDTRQAGYESPYYCWNFGGSHGTPKELAEFGDCLLRAGVRRTLLTNKHPETDPEVRKYKLTKVQFRYAKVKSYEDPKVRIPQLKKQLAEEVRLFPHCRTALVFHESGGGPFPVELYGEKTVVTPEIEAEDRAYLEKAMQTADLWKEVDPTVKLLVGNSVCPLGLLARLFRQGYPKDRIWGVGDESVGMSEPPEMSTAMPAWMLKRLVEAFGYGHVKPDAPFEFKSRVGRHQEWNEGGVGVRDALITLAWGYETVSVGALPEMANSYYDTIWGGGVFTRYPLMYPTQAYQATATLTRVLDRVRFARQLDTGSLTVYALEFARADGRTVTALWTCRGEVDVKVSRGRAADVQFVSMLGAERALAGDVVRVSHSPVYLVGSAPLDGVAVAGPRTFPEEEKVLAGIPRHVLAPLRSAAEVRVDERDEPRLRAGDVPDLSCRRGTFAVADGAASVRLEHRPNAAGCPELTEEYVSLSLENPPTIGKGATTLGVWAKGNSSWGKVRFEIVDAEGETWYSSGSGGYGCSVYDWPCKMALNYDGWHFLAFPLVRESPVKIYGPGENEYQWQRDGVRGNGVIDFPAKVTKITVVHRPHVLNLLEMRPTSPVIELRDLTAL